MSPGDVGFAREAGADAVRRDQESIGTASWTAKWDSLRREGYDGVVRGYQRAAQGQPRGCAETRGQRGDRRTAAKGDSAGAKGACALFLLRSALPVSLETSFELLLAATARELVWSCSPAAFRTNKDDPRVDIAALNLSPFECRSDRMLLTKERSSIFTPQRDCSSASPLRFWANRAELRANVAPTSYPAHCESIDSTFQHILKPKTSEPPPSSKHSNSSSPPRQRPVPTPEHSSNPCFRARRAKGSDGKIQLRAQLVSSDPIVQKERRKERTRLESEGEVLVRHDGEVLGSRKMSDAESDPGDDVLLSNRLVALHPSLERVLGCDERLSRELSGAARDEG